MLSFKYLSLTNFLDKSAPFWYSDYGGETCSSPDENKWNGWVKELFFLIFGNVELTMEWYWQGKSERLGEKPVQCYFVHHKSHWIDPGANPGHRGERPATNRLSHGTALISTTNATSYHWAQFWSSSIYSSLSKPMHLRSTLKPTFIQSSFNISLSPTPATSDSVSTEGRLKNRWLSGAITWVWKIITDYFY
jgi:hypothetical protein